MWRWWFSNLVSQVRSFHRAFLWILRVHLLDRRGLRGRGRGLGRLSPSLPSGILHSLGWREVGFCRVLGDSGCGFAPGGGKNRRRSGSLAGAFFLMSALSLLLLLCLISSLNSFLRESARLSQRLSHLSHHSDQFLRAPADGFFRCPKSFFSFLFYLWIWLLRFFYPIV